VDGARNVLTEPPFSSPDTKTQLYNGFAVSFAKLTPRILDLYISQLLQEFQTHNRNSENFVLGLLSRVNDALSRSAEAHRVIEVVIGVIPQRGLSAEPIVFNTLVSCGSTLSEKHKEMVLSSLQKFIDGPVQEVVFLFKNLPGYLRITPVGSIQRLIDNYKRRNLNEKQQVLSTARGQAIDDESRLQLLDGVLEVLRSSDPNEARRALVIMKENVSLTPADPKLRKRIFATMLERVGDEQSQVRKETLSLLSEIIDLWREDRGFTREITQKLLIWSENPELSEVARGLLVRVKDVRQTKQ
jgi:hypothetical protein